MQQIDLEEQVYTTPSPDNFADLTTKHSTGKKESRLTELSQGGGCGCKIEPAALHTILAKVPKRGLTKELLVGIEHSDDAAIYQINDKQALVFTNDFFTATIDDPYTFGRVAAANALSDIYAMGGTPMLANAIVGFPVNQLSMETMQEIMHGGVDVCHDAGIPLAGGHSIDNPQPIFGLAAIGTIHPKRIKKNSDAKVGDLIILTKPLGIGIMASAFKLDVISNDSYQEFIKHMTMLNKPGEWLGSQAGVHAMTDVTGFGLAGHLLEMAKGAHVHIQIDTANVPVMKDAWVHVTDGVVPGGAYRNMHSYGESLKFAKEWDIDQQLIFTDPQTNGGLLVTVAPEHAEHYVEELRQLGYADVCIIGQVKTHDAATVPVAFV